MRVFGPLYSCLVALLLSASFSPPILAANLPPLKDKVVLTVSGLITNTNTGNLAKFDRAGIESLGLSSFTTSTPWYKEPVKFEGVRLAKLLEAVGSKGTRLIATALNDYRAEIPVSDAHKYDVLIAVKKNGADMDVSDKGPLFIVYNFNSDSELNQRLFYIRSVWQLKTIEVK